MKDVVIWSKLLELKWLLHTIAPYNTMLSVKRIPKVWGITIEHSSVQSTNKKSIEISMLGEIGWIPYGVALKEIKYNNIMSCGTDTETQWPHIGKIRISKISNVMYVYWWSLWDIQRQLNISLVNIKSLIYILKLQL